MAKTLKLSQNLMTFLQSFVFFERPSLAKISVEQIALSYSTKPPVPFNIIITLVKLETSHLIATNHLIRCFFWSITEQHFSVEFHLFPFLSFILQFQRKILKSFKAVSSRPFPTRFPMKNEKTLKSEKWP